jgi:hypothetical protein
MMTLANNVPSFSPHIESDELITRCLAHISRKGFSLCQCHKALRPVGQNRCETCILIGRGFSHGISADCHILDSLRWVVALSG